MEYFWKKKTIAYIAALRTLSNKITFWTFWTLRCPKHVFWGLWTFFDVFTCPTNHEFLYHFLNVLVTWADPWWKLILYMLSSIWHYYFFKNNYKKIDLIVKGVSGKSGFFFNWIAYWIAYWFLLFRCGITAPCYSGVSPPAPPQAK